YLALIVAFPVASAPVPPGRLGLTVFNAVMFMLALCLVFQRLTNTSRTPAPLFPAPSLLVAALLVVPTVVLSMFPVGSLLSMISLLGGYAFFLMALAELRRERGFERITLILAIVSIVMAIGLFIDSAWHMNLSLRGSNMNQISLVNGAWIYRAAGF